MTYGTFLTSLIVNRKFQLIICIICLSKSKKDLELLTNCMNKFVMIIQISFQIHVKLT